MVRKVTFTLDDATIRRLASAAERLNKPKSEVVRDAIFDYHERVGQLSELERQRLLEALDRMSTTRSQKSARQVTAEIDEVRAARRTGGRGRGRR